MILSSEWPGESVEGMVLGFKSELKNQNKIVEYADSGSSPAHTIIKYAGIEEALVKFIDCIYCIYHHD